MIKILNEIKNVYKLTAQQLDGWNKRSQIELANLYHDDFWNRDLYLSALVVRYWNIFSKAAYQGKGIFPEEEAYDWYIDSVLKVLEERPWKDENSTLFNDEKAFEKAVNVRFFCTKVNWFQASNRQRRKINHNIISLDKLKEDYADSVSPAELIEQVVPNNDFKEMVVDAFNKKKYLLSLMIDLIINDINIDKTTTDANLISSIRKSIRSLPENYGRIFSLEYDLSEEQVVDCFESIYNMSEQRLRGSVENYIYQLRANFSKEN